LPVLPLSSWRSNVCAASVKLTLLLSCVSSTRGGFGCDVYESRSGSEEREKVYVRRRLLSKYGIAPANRKSRGGPGPVYGPIVPEEEDWFVYVEFELLIIALSFCASTRLSTNSAGGALSLGSVHLANTQQSGSVYLLRNIRESSCGSSATFRSCAEKHRGQRSLRWAQPAQALGIP